MMYSTVLIFVNLANLSHSYSLHPKLGFIPNKSNKNVLAKPKSTIFFPKAHNSVKRLNMLSLTYKKDEVEDSFEESLSFYNQDTKDEYWFDKRIHTLGNTGILGALHAAMGPISTILIDKLAYNGVDVRTKVSNKLKNLVCEKIRAKRTKVLDMCCGVGMSTRALRASFSENEQENLVSEIHGIDTSPEMIEFARVMTVHDEDLTKVLNEKRVHKIHEVVLCEKTRQMQQEYYKVHGNVIKFSKENAEHTCFANEEFDLVTIMYALHEVPPNGRNKIYEEAKRVLTKDGYLAVLDISPNYKASKSMLAGEPYVKEYQKSIHSELSSLEGFSLVEYKVFIPNHVNLWILKKVAVV